ncbi:hypothetical protein OIU77_028808 [Salix suchowensis]|uniref:Uncharacterized protein n=1 Tax=Salix suchowensis TaxID=1278906 RepID=A0ABQ9BIT6_9ROSI|nr:hypothetical protein OIU77_028808 [Salix suchowensis]
MFFPWATDAAAKFGIPRLVFHGTSNFALCAGECVRLYEPHKKVSSDSEPFVVPSLPGDIKLTRKQLPGYVREDVEDDFTKLLKTSKESELRSFGVVVNSFYELEPAYADHHRKLVTDVLTTGVAVGVKEWVGVHGDHVTLKSEAIEKAVTRIMVGVEADEKRSRARKLGETARKAVEKGGSSFSDFNALIEELRRHRP